MTYRVRYTQGSLGRVGVSILNRHNILLQCSHCGARWSPNLRWGGLFRRGWWKCYNGCNKDANA